MNCSAAWSASSTANRRERVGWDTSAVVALQEDEDKRQTRWKEALGSGAVTVFEYRMGIGLPADDSHRFYLRSISVIEVPESDGKALAIRPAETALPAPKEQKANAGERPTSAVTPGATDAEPGRWSCDCIRAAA
jgi:hypothetical protein